MSTASVKSDIRRKLRRVLCACLATAALFGAGSGQGATVTYDYDDLGRLKKATHPDGTVVDYNYDGAGNRTSVVTGTLPVTFNVAAASATEGATLSFTVTKVGTSLQTTTVDCATSSGSATSGTDFTATSTTLTFLPADTSKPCTVATTQDATFEGNETLTATLGNPSAGATLGTATATGTINEDDSAPSFAINDVSVAENGTSVTFTVSKTGATALAHTVAYATANGTATAGSDYTAASGTLSFASADTSKTFTVAVSDDTTFEGNETFTAALSAPSNGALIGDASGTATITENDAAPTLVISDQTATEGAVLTFTVTRSGATALSHSVNYATASGSATSGVDFTATSGTLTFAPADTSKTFTVTTTQDTVFEQAEGFTAVLSAPTNGIVLADGTGAGTISEDDSAPSFSINDPSVAENGTSLTFTVTKAGSTALSHAVNYATASGTAVSGTDFSPASGTLTFASADTSKTFTVSITDDSTYEGSETLTASLSGPTNGAAISDASGTGTLTENDPGPAFSINDPSVNENGGTLTFTVTKAGGTALTHDVSYATASATATSGSDFAAASGTLSFAAADSSRTFSVTLTDDSTYEGSETLAGSLSGATNGATIADSAGTGTINENDPAPAFSVNDVSVAENGGSVSFTVTKSGTTALSHAVNYATANGTATAGSSLDYVAASGTLTFTSAETSKNVAITIVDDQPPNGPPVWENSETFTLGLSNATNGATFADASGLCTITENEATPQFSVDSPGAVTEGGSIVFTVSRWPLSAFTHAVDYATANGTATAPGDYTSTSGTLTFLASDSSKTFSVSTIDDASSEAATETFSINLSGATNGATVGGAGTGSIADNDLLPGVPPSISVSPTYTTSGNYTVSWGASSGTVTNYELQQQLNFGGWGTTWSETGTSKGFTNKPSGDWTYRVRACNANGCSAWREEATVNVCRNGNC